MQYDENVTWIVELLDARVQDELEALPADMRARFRRIVELIQDYGLERVREPHVKHLEGPLWEMRMTRQRRSCPGDLRRRKRPAGGRGPGVRQEGPKDASAGD